MQLANLQLLRNSRFGLPWGVVMSVLMVTGCGAEFQTMESAAPTAGAPPMAEADMKAGNAQVADQAVVFTATSVPQAAPQLAKRASLKLVVASMDQALEQVLAIAKAQQGDLLNLQNQTPSSRSPHVAQVQIRVPQAHLEATLADLTKLGTIEQQTVTAEDVSTQLVDFQARLRNLRKTEEMLIEIMDRSGTMPEVLQVSQELSNVRASIEQVDAQLKALQNRVAYTTIDVALEAAIAEVPPRQELQPQLQNTWQQARYSMQGFTVGLVKVGLWLLAYSPYLLIVAIAIGLSQRLWRRPATVQPTSEQSPPEA